MKKRANAKVNLALDVVGQYDNGYHELDMIMAPISVEDVIEVDLAEKDCVSCLGMILPETNTITKMIRLLKDTFQLDHCYEVKVQKHIPMQAGLAGGSADAAAVMNAILEIENIGLTMEEKYALGKQIGADVPFCLCNQWARVKGIGEIIEPIHSDWKIQALLVKPAQGVSTPEAFQLWSQQKEYHPDVDLVQIAVEKKSIELLVQTMGNALQTSAFTLVEELKEIKKEMLKLGMVHVLMSGSGSSLLGFSVETDVLLHAKEELEKVYPFVRIITIG